MIRPAFCSTVGTDTRPTYTASNCYSSQPSIAEAAAFPTELDYVATAALVSRQMSQSRQSRQSRQSLHRRRNASCLPTLAGDSGNHCIAASPPSPTWQIWPMLLSAQCLSLPRGVALRINPRLRSGCVSMCVWRLRHTPAKRPPARVGTAGRLLRVGCAQMPSHTVIYQRGLWADAALQLESCLFFQTHAVLRAGTAALHSNLGFTRIEDGGPWPKFKREMSPNQAIASLVP